jgi:hypothetical protein
MTREQAIEMIEKENGRGKREKKPPKRLYEEEEQKEQDEEDEQPRKVGCFFLSHGAAIWPETFNHSFIHCS